MFRHSTCASVLQRLAFRDSPCQAFSDDQQHLRPSPTPATNSRRAFYKVIVTTSSGAVNLDTCSLFTVEYFASPRRLPRHLHAFDCQSESLSHALVRLSGVFVCASATALRFVFRSSPLGPPNSVLLFRESIKTNERTKPQCF